MTLFTPSAQPLLAVKGLVKHFPVKRTLLGRPTSFVFAVDGVEFSVYTGETLGIVGESGSGKSTLGFALLKLLKSEGKIIWLGKDISPLPAKAMRALRKDMQLVFQDPYGSLNPRMTVGDIIAEGLRIHTPVAERNHQTPQQVRGILEEVGLPAEAAHRYPHEFSGGQRQRIAIARAMVLKPKFIVLDEPTSALDLTVQSQIIELLRSFQSKYAISYLFISHDLRVVRAISHHIAVLYKGKIVEVGASLDVLQNPKADYTKKLIEAAML